MSTRLSEAVRSILGCWHRTERPRGTGEWVDTECGQAIMVHARDIGPDPSAPPCPVCWPDSARDAA